MKFKIKQKEKQFLLDFYKKSFHSRNYTGQSSFGSLIKLKAKIQEQRNRKDKQFQMGSFES